MRNRDGKKSVKTTELALARFFLAVSLLYGTLKINFLIFVWLAFGRTTGNSVTVNVR